ncbi:hypothetical protein GGQ74_001281 [Desulfobaculum xiamenense]|uniref:Uncharacterized protein n=1 Tax=Desulfobaculum xiamenense TaxID=995050 RepID=A0A846QHF1_9BACT|nr:hypothetical protein [Desulfobaculum xiamenense]NJB67641.1 hypothetical protein [Desulfobaculum xiamenense]
MHAPYAFPPAIIESHPLVRRLSGQIIWCMFEEYDAAPEDIQAFLDLYDAERARALSAVSRIVAPTADDNTGGIMIRLRDTGHVCPFCEALNGRFLPVGHPELLHFLPPFGLGCAAYAEVLTREQVAALPAAQRIDTSLVPPCDLTCGEWIFTRTWSAGIP